MSPTNPAYPQEFRAEAVALVRSSPDRSIPQIAAELGVSDTSLRDWVKRAEIDRGKRGGLTTDEREELRRLRRENRRLEQEREILKKSRGLLRQRDRGSVGEVFSFIDAKKARYPLATMCRVLEVSRSGFLEHKVHEQPQSISASSTRNRLNCREKC